MENQTNNEAVLTVPYVVYEGAQVRSDRRDRRHWIAHLVSLLVIALIVAGFLIYLNQYEFATEEVVTTVDSTGQGIANFTGGDGGVIYGPSDSP